MLPHEIERESFRIIREEMKETGFSEEELAVVVRVIHATADFDFQDIMRFHPQAIKSGMAALRQGEAYGYELLQKLAGVDGLAITESTVYPILSRLKKEGSVKVRVAPSPAGPPRRYYRLTGLGRARLNQMERYWNEIQTSANALLQGGPD